ncbi:zinc ribbon domain-containing protein [Pedobacter hiemivivus]|uniref:zinc ribbon domain-containing protein n=1 Tax=Pedobacter hiemivivus TaxID=2530454 RepID=UPI0019814AEF|nr:zinc ribbon domain-containing protein [Pedobacter hiemivivus]
MNCIRCNAPNAPEAKFCKNCGTTMITPEMQTKTDHQTIKALLIIIGVDYLLSAVMFLIQKATPLVSHNDGDFARIDLVYKVYGWTSDIVTLAVMLFFLATIKNQTVKTALIAFIVLRFIFMLGYRVFPFFL